MYRGHPREDFTALARAVEATGMAEPLIIEAGCGSGWNSEVLTHMLQRQVRYIGMDYSHAMVQLGQQHYPHQRFVAGDATRLPFANDACDILVSGTVLIHLIGYREAIAESQRVARSWCIFHTVPIIQYRPTTILRKRAYGEPVVEVVYNQDELFSLLQENNLTIAELFDNVSHSYLNEILKTKVTTQTLLCKIGKGVPHHDK
jgi:ubiquinone/menaquinone biosynthesis C-methylase UbiE